MALAAARCAALTAVAALFAFSFGTAASAQELKGRELKIGAIVPSSGPFAEWGRTNTVALKVLEDEVNKAGGVKGATLKIVVYDDAAQPAQAANNLRKLAADDKVLAVAGPLTSSACEVAFPVANQLKIVATSQASSKPGVAAANRPWAFRNTVDESLFAKQTVPYLKSAFKVASVAVVYDAKDAVSTSISTAIMPAAMEANGIAVLNKGKYLSFNTGDIDVSAQVTAMKAMNPDAVVIGADYSQAITVLREMRRQGLTKPVIGGSPLISSAILKTAPDIPIIAPATFYSGMQGAKAKAFGDKITAELRKTKGLPPEIEASMYDANITEIVQMYLDAARKEKITLKPEDIEADRTLIRDHMAKLTGYEGLGGKVSFNKSGDAIKSFFVVQGQKGAWSSKVAACSSEDGKC